MKKLFVLGLILCAVTFIHAQAPTPAPHSATISWTAPSPDAVANPTGIYNVYRAKAVTNCADTALTYTKVGSASPATALTFVDNSVLGSTTYCYAVTFAAGGLESVFSNIAQAVIPPDPSPLRPPPGVFNGKNT